MDQSVLTICLDRELLDKLNQLARDCECSRDSLLNDAVRRFVEEESELMAAIKEGESDLEEGRYVTHEQFMEELKLAFSRKDAA